MGAADAAARVAENAQQAVQLFQENGGLTREREPVPHTFSPPPVPSEPWRSTVTTTVARETAGMTRAKALEELAVSNLAFLHEISEIPEILRAADAAVRALQQFMSRNASDLGRRLDRNAELLRTELRQVRRELARNRSRMRAEASPAQIEATGRANLLALNRERLEALLSQTLALRRELRAESAPPKPPGRPASEPRG